ncbi:MAG: hypothetical protein AAF790_13935, partial [Planctomycetota bacterium]
MTCAADAAPVDTRYWTLTPYRVRVLIAVDARSLPSKTLADRVAEHITERTDAAIGPIWKLTAEPLAGAARVEALTGHSPERLLALARGGDQPADKLMMVTIRELPTGVTVTAVECDPLLEMQGRPQTTQSGGLADAAETAFALVCRVFSPVALLEVDREKGDEATLIIRGSQLPTRIGAPDWLKPGDVMQPILRRTNREGELAEDGIQPVPWTFMVIRGA